MDKKVEGFVVASATGISGASGPSGTMPHSWTMDERRILEGARIVAKEEIDAKLNELSKNFSGKRPPLTRNEKIGVAVGILGAVGVGIGATLLVQRIKRGGSESKVIETNATTPMRGRSAMAAA